MQYWHGYVGKILDLTTESIKEAELESVWAENYMGGKGLGSKILYDQLPTSYNPLSEENILIFATGPLTGTFAPSSGGLKFAARALQQASGSTPIEEATLALR